MNLIC